MMCAPRLNGSKKGAFRICAIIFACFFALSGAKAADENRDQRPRAKLISKYATSPLRDIVISVLSDDGTKESFNAAEQALEKLANMEDDAALDLVIDLDPVLDGALGEDIREIACLKGTSIINPLKKRMMQASSSEVGALVDLLEWIVSGLPCAIEWNEEEVSRVNLYYIQKALNEFRQRHGRYPETLNPVQEIGTETVMFMGGDDVLDGWGNKIEYYPGDNFYFLQSRGKDGVLGTGDDVLPPLDKAIHTYPLGK